MRNVVILLVAGLVVALPFVLRREEPVSAWSSDDPVLVIISPHNEAIRYEFGRAFSKWHHEHYATPVKVDWRVIGGTTEIMRYLGAAYVSSFKAWWRREDRAWPDNGGAMILDHNVRADLPPGEAEGPAAAAAWELKRRLHGSFRDVDDAGAFGSGIDLFFGGGVYDHDKAARQGLSVPPWTAPPDGLFADAEGNELLPERRGGETWRSTHFFGVALSTFGICYNVDRILDLGIEKPPAHWQDLADARYVGQLGVADPTKSGSIAKAFEMIVHQQCRESVRAAGFNRAAVDQFEQVLREARLPPGEMPRGVPPEYQAAVEEGWEHGIHLIQMIAANARYFTDSASKVPIDVSMGDAAAGLAIDFYGRYQAETSRAPDGRPRMKYVTPRGGSSVSADPISLLRGAPNREVAVRFVEFVLSREGQALWNQAPGTPGGPHRFALRRLPVRRDFYPSSAPGLTRMYETTAGLTVDDLGRPDVNPYVLSDQFVYRPRWTARHFGVHRKLIRAMCLDAGVELRAAWRAIIVGGGPELQPEAMQALRRLPDHPERMTWRSITTIFEAHDELTVMRDWTIHFREAYREAERIARENSGRAEAG
ncbi:MAG: extracellular solute-binding protein [Verrucomicrobia bacterium]|nr:extracellular solute-binding protein [Verrucomicrobiota bacterium]MDA1087910.1 extracellular solute-binding protein [Verrucomicrobiota bacterium]